MAPAYCALPRNQLAAELLAGIGSNVIFMTSTSTGDEGQFRIWPRAILVGVILLLVSLLILAVAEIYAPAAACKEAKLWTLCLLRADGNLSGGIIGAAGTIFAGYLAWCSVLRERSLAQHDRRLIQKSAKESAFLLMINAIQTLARIEVSLRKLIGEKDKSKRTAVWNSIRFRVQHGDVMNELRRIDALSREMSASDRTSTAQVAGAIESMIRSLVPDGEEFTDFDDDMTTKFIGAAQNISKRAIEFDDRLSEVYKDSLSR